jgi:hypothetical protein
MRDEKLTETASRKYAPETSSRDPPLPAVVGVAVATFGVLPVPAVTVGAVVVEVTALVSRATVVDVGVEAATERTLPAERHNPAALTSPG